MSLRSALAAFGQVFSRKKSSTPLRDALEEFARAVTPKATKKKFSEQQRTLTKLAQRMLALSAVAGAEDNKVIAGACTLLAGALTRQVRGQMRASDDDWRWLARWPEMLLDCLAGGYNEAEALVRHLLEPSWADLLSPGAVHVLLERLNDLPDAPAMPSPELMSLYEQYCSHHPAGDQDADKPDVGRASEQVESVDEAEIPGGPEKVEEVEKVDGVQEVDGVHKGDAFKRGEGFENAEGFDNEQGFENAAGLENAEELENAPGFENAAGLENVESVDGQLEDAEIAAQGTGLVADSVEPIDSIMESSMVGYVPADDIKGHDNVYAIHASGDTAMTGFTATEKSITDTDISGLTVSTTSAKPDGETPVSSAKEATDEENVDEPRDRMPAADGNTAGTIDGGPVDSESDGESVGQESNDDSVTDDAPAGDEMNESTATMEVLTDVESHDSNSQQSPESDTSRSESVETGDRSPAQIDPSDNETGLLGALKMLGLGADKTADDQDNAKQSTIAASMEIGVNDEPQGTDWPAMLDAINEEQVSEASVTGQPHSSGGGAVQLPLPEIEVIEWVAPEAGDAIWDSKPFSEMDFVVTVDTTADGQSLRDDATADMFDELEATVAGNEEDMLYATALAAAAQAEAEDAGAVLIETNTIDPNTGSPNADDEISNALGGADQIDDGHAGIAGFELEEIDADAEAEAQAALRMLDEQSAGAPTLDDIFDAFDGTAVDDDKAISLDEFVLEEEAPTTINDDLRVVAESAVDEKPGLLASLKSAVFGSREASKDEEGVEVTNDAAPLSNRKLSRAAMQIVEVLLAELPAVEVELATCAGLGASTTPDRKLVGEAAQRSAEVLTRYASAADSVGFIGLAKVVEFARERVLSVAQTETLSDRQVGLFSEFSKFIHAYFEAPFAPESAQTLLDWISSDGWATVVTIDEPDILLSLLANPDLSAIDEDVPGRQQEANPEDVSLAVPADANRDLLDGLLQELPLQSEEFSAAIERLMHDTGTLEDILVAQRIAHTIKGSGNTVGIRGLAALTHNIEDILLVLAQEKRLPSRPLADMLMNAADRLQAMTESLLGMGPPPDDALDVLQSVLDWANLIDREGLPPDNAAPESLPQLIPQSLVRSPEAPVPAAPAVAASTTPDVAERAKPASGKESDQKVDDEQKGEQELDVLLRVPAKLVDQMLTTAGESIILTGQLRDRVRRGLADVHAMFAQFERQQQLGGELEELIDIKDFSSRQTQHDSRFDALEMDQYNELHSAARQLAESATDAREMGRTLVDHLTNLDEMLIGQEALNRDTQDTVLNTRMVEVKSVFARLQRAVRQTCRATEKQVELHLSGGETPMDSDALNRIVDPLMHLLRNAIDHGIEDAATRLSNGKAATGNVYLDFQRNGNNIVIQCRDDGAGLDFDAIRQTAEERGLVGPDASPEALKQIILRANFSTRSQATQVSGRGIGLDAVHDGVAVLGGTMTVESETGQGCSFELRLPFNLISSHAVLVRAGPNVVALASRGVEQIVHGRDGEMQRFGDKTVFQIGENVYPATTLETVIGASNERREGERHIRPVVLTRTDEGVTAVSVEAVIGSRDLVVKSLGKHMPKLRGVVGATILGDGQVASVIDLPDMLSNREVRVEEESATATDSSTERSAGFVLVVDDSLSARRALAQFMQDSGYRVRTARDGVEATQIMEGASPDLVLADLEMPRMNGIELTAHLRANAKTADVPVIMVTSRSTTKHREQAQVAGVNVYLTKPYSEDVLIETVRRLIGDQEAKRRERPAA